MRVALRSSVLLLVGAGWACAPRPTPVSPAEISELGGRVAREPTNGEIVLRYAAALNAAGRCDTAMTVARRGMALAPRNAVGPLVIGQCLERAEQYGDALALYRKFLADNPGGSGAAAVRSRELLASRAQATQLARTALAQETALAAQPADPQTVAVLPVQISGDSTYQPLSRGLAAFLTSDLALLRRFRMVERMQLSALLDEMKLGQAGRVDPATAARVGQLVRAGRMVQGLAAIPGEQDVRLEASVLVGSGEVSSPAGASGQLKDLLRIEKDVVIGLADRMGYTLSEAERRAVLENGTQNLTAFLAYSRALEAEDRGDYQAAARFYSEAAQIDPGFTAAREGFQAAVVTASMQDQLPADVTVQAGQSENQAVAQARDEVLGGEGAQVAGQSQVQIGVGVAVGTVSSAIGSSIGDLAPTQAEQTNAITSPTQLAVKTTTAQPPPPTVVPPATATGTIRIVFRLP